MVEFDPNQLDFALIHGKHLPTHLRAAHVHAGEAFVFEDVSVSMAQLLHGMALTIIQRGVWSIKAISKPILRSAVMDKKQINLAITPLRDPLEPNARGRVVAPHGIWPCVSSGTHQSQLPSFRPTGALLWCFSRRHPRSSLRRR